MHLLKERDIKDICPYCREKISDSMEWKSEFCSSLHYKIGKCESCGRDLRIRVDFHGSGHDLWHKIKDYEWENRKNIHDLIKKMWM